ALEICQIASRFACLLHHLSLCWSLLQHMHPLTKPTPLILMTEHDEQKYPRVIVISLVTWICPILIFTVYFWSIPCQGFQSIDCDFTFFLTFNHRLVVLGPMVMMVVIVLVLFI